ncbi:restriction endonuclease [Rhodoferax lacus]|uniref:Restriction endonuclease n=1 Tax=Rhodoferax lacus TaxID=2184758 RepID=A0A3E1RI55_9BURK|nr:restriction endonuclease [Rhodoferax lacus]RFO98290.1 restriction endonuclease [Rhodoferax lacus]
MARRGKTSPLEDVFELVAMLPWWGGVAAAIALYVGLHAYASQVVAPVTTTPQLVGSVSGTIFRTIAGFFQYILPVICLGAAAASAWKASQRKSLVQGVTASTSASSLDGMTWLEFEGLVGEAFRQKGYKVLELGGAGPDGGVDLVLTKGSEKLFVQCKQWKAFKVGVDVVRQLYGVMAAKGAAGGFVVTSGKFTTDALEFARGRNVTLLDGDRLFAMLQAAKAGRKAGISSATAQVAAAPLAAPGCPVCGSAMVKREAKRGTNAGNAFWGCSKYPKCRGTVQI